MVAHVSMSWTRGLSRAVLGTYSYGVQTIDSVDRRMDVVVSLCAADAFVGLTEFGGIVGRVRNAKKTEEWQPI